MDIAGDVDIGITQMGCELSYHSLGPQVDLFQRGRSVKINEDIELLLFVVELADLCANLMVDAQQRGILGAIPCVGGHLERHDPTSHARKPMMEVPVAAVRTVETQLANSVS